MLLSWLLIYNFPSIDSTNGRIKTDHYLHIKNLIKYRISVLISKFNIVIDGIPLGVIMLFKITLGQYPIWMPFDPINLEIRQICFCSPHNSNHNIRSLFQKQVVSTSYVIIFWNKLINNLNWEKIWNLPARYIINNKVKEVSFKITHRMSPSVSFFLKTI